MSPFESIILGIVQGITEFLPISSTGHLILVRTLFGVQSGDALAFDAVLHLATALAVVIYFHRDIWVLVQTALRKLGRQPVNERDWELLLAIIIGTIPAAALGVLLESYMETVFRSTLVVAGVLLVGSILFVAAELLYVHSARQSRISVRTGFKIGLFQCLALIPGFSRSGATISGGMLLGLSRSEAARFAFLLAVPIMLGAGSKKLLELLTSDVVTPWFSVGLGAVVAFITGLFAIHFMLSFIRRHTLWPFIWYRVVLAVFVIFLTVFA